MARGTDFGGVHSFTDLHLIQQKVEVQPAEPKTNFIDIPGADGSKDLTEQPAGRVVFKTRKLTWTFALYPGDSWDAKHQEVSNAINGRSCKIVLDTDPEWFYLGRVAVKKYKTDGLLRQITVEATCQPYKQKLAKIREFLPYSGKNLLDVKTANLTPYKAGLSDIDDGVRLTWYNDQIEYARMVIFPVDMVAGKTVAFSGKMTAVGGVVPRLEIGYATSDLKSRTDAMMLIRSGSSTVITIPEDIAEEYEYLTLTLYCNYYTDPAGISAGAYVDFTEIQLEISDVATEYEPYYSTAGAGEEVHLHASAHKIVTPTVICTKDDTMLIVYGDNFRTYDLAAGAHRLLDAQLAVNETRVGVISDGPVAIVYREVSL